jgi:hypothetical protein
MQEWAAWGAFWGDSWSWSWGPLHAVEEDEYIYRYDRKKHARHVREVIRQEHRRHDDDDVLILCML